MSKLIEEKVKNIVENNMTLNIREKSEIICLIECYKGADKLSQDLFKENEKLKAAMNEAFNILKHDVNFPELCDGYEVLEILKIGGGIK